MKLLPTLASYALAGNKSIDHWVNNFDTEALIKCGAGASMDGATHVSWFRTGFTADRREGPTVEVAEQDRQAGVVVDQEVKVEGYSIDENGALSFKKEAGFAPEDIAKFECKILKGATPEDYKYKLLVNFLLDRNNLTPVVRHKKLGKKNNMEYKEGAQYDIAECESKEAGPSPATLKWRALNLDGRVFSDSSEFSACSSGDDSNFCGKTNDYLNVDKKDQRALQTTTLPLGFTAENFGGIRSDFDETYFECVATYNVARNGALEPVTEVARWPEGDENIRVLHPVKNVEILVDGAAVQAGVLETTYGEPELSCDSDGFDNESENEVEDERETVGGDRIKFGCKARNGRNENGWVQKSYVFTAASLGEPKIAKSHGGIVVEVSAESSPARAKQTSAVFSCATLPKSKPKGTKANRDMFNFLADHCVEATAFGDDKRHVVSQNSKKKNPILVAVSMLEVTDSDGNTETLYNYKIDAATTRTAEEPEVAEFPIEAWFAETPVGFGEPDDQIKAFYFDEEQAKLVPVAGGFVDQKNDAEHEGEFHANVEPQPTESGNYVLCYDYEGNFDAEQYSGKSYEDIQKEILAERNDFCRFYENKSWLGGMMALIWIPILLLLALAVYCIWLQCFKNNEEDEDAEDPEDPPTKIPVNDPVNDPTAGPELQAVEQRIERLQSDVRDDFTQEDETTPMMQEQSE